jgi:peptide/nickel transport system permease protein
MRVKANTAIGGTLIGCLGLVAIVAQFWTPYDPNAIDILHRLAPPSAAHWLGTDEFGRDQLSRAMVGAGTSAFISVATVTCAIISGSIVGVVTGYFGGWPDRILMALNDALLAFPGILLALAVLVVVGGSTTGLILALAIAYTPAVARLARGMVMSLRTREFVEASRMIGNSEFYSMIRHVVPNCVGPLTVLATAMLGWVLLAESALSFLGLGVPPPASNWGDMLAASRPYMQSAVWLELVPGFCITLTLLGINLLGDALRDRFDPRLRVM